MPSIATQYTPLESLLFVQSIARNGTDSAALSSISRSLTTNLFVQSDAKYDAQRLAPEALKNLYDELVHREGNDTSLSPSERNGAGGVNPRKRKLSVSPDPSGRIEDGARKAARLVDRLYATYRDRLVQEIKQEETEYKAIVTAIKTLETEAQRLQEPDVAPARTGLSTVTESQSAVAERSLSPGKDGLHPAGAAARDGTPFKDAIEKQEPPPPPESKLPQPSAGQMLPPQPPALDVSHLQLPLTVAESQRPATPSSSHSPAPPSGTPGQGQQQSQKFPPRHGSIQSPLPPPSTTSPRSSNALPPLSSIVPQALPPAVPPPQRKSTGSVPPRTSPLLPCPAPQYPQSPIYGYPYPAWPQYNSPTSPYANPQFYSQQPYPPNHPSSQSPIYNHYPPYHQSSPPNQYGPGPYPPLRPGQSPQYPQFPWPGRPASASSTPSGRRSADRPRIRASGTSTPWTPGGIRRASPERPVRERDVSPLSDRGVSLEDAGDNIREVEQKTISKETTPRNAPKRGRGRDLRGTRAGSTHSSALASRSRSQSLASLTSETRPERVVETKRATRRVKPEPPSTPAPLTSDGEQRASGRRRGRSDALHPAPPESGRNANKRKRDSGTQPSSSPSVHSPHPLGRRTGPRAEPIDPSLVTLTRNFARMAAPTLSDMNAHKRASIFAKPLTEREAPGYRDLIYRPQDLKSIRAAVGRGSRAANTMIDEIEALADEGITGSPAAAKTATLSGSALVSKTDELIPPKGIVNSAQLEMELMRMFANAVMFNPLPPSERGLPPELKMQKDGPHGTSRRLGEDEDDEEEKEKGYAPEELEDDGGIIQDTREMFEGVERAVSRWRGVEHGYVDDVPRSGAAIGGGISLRGGSVGVSDAVAEESAQEDGDAARAGIGTTRKRRRLLE